MERIEEGCVLLWNEYQKEAMLKFSVRDGGNIMTTSELLACTRCGLGAVCFRQ